MRVAPALPAAVEDQVVPVLEVWPAAGVALRIAVPEGVAGYKGLAVSSAEAARMGPAAAAGAGKVYAAVHPDTADAESMLADTENRVQTPVPVDSADGTGNTEELRPVPTDG